MGILFGAVVMFIIMWANNFRFEWKEPGIFILVLIAIQLHNAGATRKPRKDKGQGNAE